MAMVNSILVPLTTHGVLEFIDNLASRVKSVLKESGVESDIVIWPSVVKPPTRCFDWGRVQYHANCVIGYLRDFFRLQGVLDRFLVIGVGYIDGYEHGLNFVFGEAIPGEGVAVVFTKRLRPEYYNEPVDYNLYFNRLVKEVVHELGHLLGLEHCSIGNCVMRFSNSVYEVDGKREYFCDNCRLKLRQISRTK